MSENNTPEGWYPVDGGQERWWDGTAWGDATRPAGTPAAPTPTVVAPAPPSAAAPAAPREKNVLGFVALGVAVLGFIFACIPGALIVGWVLLPIAFVLGIVALFLRGKSKWAGITAIIVSIVGTVVGIVVFIAVVATSFSNAFGDSDVEVSITEETSTPADESTQADSGTESGSRENAVPLGSTITGNDWTVVVNSFTADANQLVADANMFNEAPAAGFHYSTVNYTVTYTGTESGYAATVGVALVTASGEVLESFDAMAALTDSIGLDELYNGGTATGSAAFLVPDGAEVLIRVTPGFFTDDVFVTP